MTRVLIAVDETEESVHAAETARHLFGADAEYLAVSVADQALDAETVPWWQPAWGVAYPVPYGAVWPYPGVEREPTAESVADAAVETARVATEESGLPDAEAVGAVGDPADAIMTVAEARAADVIVVGSRDRGWLDRLVRPSVSKDVLRRTDVPVLLVKPTAGNAND